ncbi:MAG: S-layer homology domain-containing protein [Oscillospiraceae bacterium]
MKTSLRKLLSLTLALLLTVTPALASDALGSELTKTDTLLGETTALGRNVFWSSAYSDLRTEHLVTYTPNAAVLPVVTYGSVITERGSVSSAAKELEAQGYRVLAGINGDFYNMGNGVPIGLVVEDGIVRTGGAGYYAIGFRADGTAILGKPGLTYSLNLGTNASGEQVIRQVTELNKARVSDGGIYLYTHEFNSRHTTGSTEAGVDVLCSITSGSLSIGQSATLQVQQVIEATTATAIPEGMVVLSANSKSNAFYTDALRRLLPGQELTFSIASPDAGWNDVRYAVGSLYSLVTDGVVNPSLEKGVAPRTAIGQKPDGTLVFYTIDGRQSGYSVGASLTQVAQRLVELGCTTALCLDGGGSTTLSVTSPDKTAAATLNRPSDKVERSVTNQIFLVATNQPTGVLHHLYVTSDNQYVLAGSSVKITASGVDTNYIPMSTDYSLTADSGAMTDNLLTTPKEGGDVTVTATGGGQSGSTVIHAVTTPDNLTISSAGSKLTTLTVSPGETVTLTGAAIKNHLTLASDSGAFAWTVTGDIGTVDQKGAFTAGDKVGSGTVAIAAGGKTASIPVTVAPLSLQTLEDFEKAPEGYTDDSIVLTRDTAAEHARFGHASGKLDYQMVGQSATLYTPYTFRQNYSTLNLWVYGDKSGNTLALCLPDGTSVPAAVLDFSGWKQLSVTLPKGTTGITALTITGTTLTDGDGNYVATPSTGTIWLDQLVNSYGGRIDVTPPVVTASLKDLTLTATLQDDMDGFPAQTGVAVTYDGKPQPFTYHAATGALTATLPAPDGKGHRVSVLARDGSGNLSRASCDVAATAAAGPFNDTAGSTLAPYIDHLYTSGVTTGYPDGTFRPNFVISRQEFAVMLYRYLHLDEAKYADVALPFSDLAQIDEFARPAVRALYTEGILNGTADANGILAFHPAGAITRAQAATMLGRTQLKGYAAPALTFKDAATIPGYAAFYVSTMAAQGVLGGFPDGTFQPNAPISRGQMAKLLYCML